MAYRIKLFDEWKREFDEEVRDHPRSPIKITLPDGRQMLKGRTSLPKFGSVPPTLHTAARIGAVTQNINPLPD
ncbi:hypothetical protein M427DRAFT_133961 [Gonapodya prolifera JEL478]|uniref:Uncharacterized protein n=1 Tax=Gonapodya prolifera (strain JEL478) TaxID=1344416 RepID=A0A139AIS3_GONPJ|nr:hypothetical protein M427DRAFT_133961 [Gonapodya prolifera JEL478]|eukprot:KXS16609.1 hypothetical protein M427DRAFT_133961 [Gonapodya prolifera JEL478]